MIKKGIDYNNVNPPIVYLWEGSKRKEMHPDNHESTLKWLV